MKMNCVQKTSKKKQRNRKRSKRRKAGKRKQKYLNSSHKVIEYLPFHQTLVMNNASYWKNYQNAMKWQQRCMQYSHKSIQLPAGSSSKFDGPNRSFENEEYNINNDESYYDERSNDSDDIEVSEELMAFLEKSMKHKEEMKLKKEAEARLMAIEEEMAEPGRDDIEECKTPHRNKIDENKLRELYGQDWEKILGMETSLQLVYNNHCDIYKPPYWPCLPLKMKF